MGDWIPVIGCLGFTALVIMPFITNKIIKYKLEIARISAETTVRTEEIRNRNQLELEMYMNREEHKQNTQYQKRDKSVNSDLQNEESLESPSKSRVRI